ncbi:Uncharacterized protein HSRCO_0581 [Halanaeroarchaeum sp. HSR-CO]|uniref:hypothetical protein n=1 Tax=Halanaeroarchaeum sp. HSR-CO TaxID=2866382 RepID=UPI00217DBC86|nr:hypothetical protein [Halanaeroarchaeum sp. HSR-CO]UWG46876.1 Uncharacterized protein HSRCO_0581 [Halanaeroarchaeum sp. HSR-CO]
MHGRPMRLGLVSTLVGIGGYVLGLVVDYPGRAFSVTLAMVGITLLVIGDDWGDRG